MAIQINPNQTEASFGLIPVARRDDVNQFLLIQHQAGHWGFPKGHAEPGETPLETACREFEEETGIRDYEVNESLPLVEVYRFVKAQKNKTQKTIEKTVTYFVAWVQSMQVRPQEKEIQDYLWLPYEAALAQISFEQSQQLLVEANRVIQDLTQP
jgi:bis(5'-nucleosidyl)-tetraphosphatase